MNGDDIKISQAAMRKFLLAIENSNIGIPEERLKSMFSGMTDDEIDTDKMDADIEALNEL